jgi:hypothetical protein
MFHVLPYGETTRVGGQEAEAGAMTNEGVERSEEKFEAAACPRRWAG